MTPAPPRGTLPEEVLAAADALAKGEPILLFDERGREEETDLFVLAEHCTPEKVHMLRRDGGGLVFVAMERAPADILGLPFLHDVLDSAKERFPVLGETVPQGLPYDARSSFSLWVNHRDTYTGITDVDRSRTITALAETATDAMRLDDPRRGPVMFGERFRSPGHVSICVGHSQGLHGRHGHTELATALAAIGGATPVVAGCEMLDGTTGRARNISDAEKYARSNGLLFLDGETLIEAFRTWRPTAR
ncbi:MAG: 3,4-dihydroxy-2-butanone-4-phosphate synthase [Euryarchaeota archaeon]|nr:3,4-dihydroxy-2-butanone-4-phosphate synthase [Euryarchaeota archaeon]